MGLDIYVGTFTRYYRRDWLTIVQQSFPGRVDIVRSPENAAGTADPKEIQQIVADWAAGLSLSLKLSSPWSEDDQRPYFTDKPAWDGYGALMLWAAYEDQGISPGLHHQPITTQNCMDDPVLKKYDDRRVDTRYAQLLLGEEMWLPIPSPSVFRSVDAAGNERMFGNCGKLLAELDLLNSRTWKATPETADAWRREGCEHGSSLEVAARFGWAVVHGLAGHAVAHRLPMILDY
jgi:hypothetical protein